MFCALLWQSKPLSRTLYLKTPVKEYTIVTWCGGSGNDGSGSSAIYHMI